MAKRRLSKQQIERIKQRRNAQHEVTESTSDDSLLGPEQEGLVLSHYGKQADIEMQDGSVVRCHLRANLGTIVAGDKVLWRLGPDSGVVTALFPRHTELQRPDSFGKLRVVAANVTRLVIVVAPEPQAFANLIDRYLVVAENLQLEPVLLLNKADLLTPDHSLPVLLNEYAQLGYTVHAISAHLQSGMDAFRQTLSTGISIFVGQSGVGKSSVIQALLPNENIKIGELSEHELKGRHTTTHAQLYHFPFGGDCIDSPGIREFGLWHFSAEQVSYGFREFREPMENCRFRDCSHTREPGCGLLKAVEDGRIRPARFDSYRQIVTSLSAVDVHSTP